MTDIDRARERADDKAVDKLAEEATCGECAWFASWCICHATAADEADPSCTEFLEADK